MLSDALKKSFSLFLIGLCALSGASFAKERNIILIIGDGMDDQQITLARNYLEGVQGKLNLDRMPVRSAVQVLSVSDREPEKVVYVADSANSATAVATGVVTSRGRIGTSAGEDKDLISIIDLAEKAGMKTGIVTTASITDATPASFMAKVKQRECENPSMMVNALYHDRKPVDCSSDTKAKGGAGSIAEQIADSDVDLFLGGGFKHFEFEAEGKKQTVLNSAKKNGFHVLDASSDLNGLPADKKILGLFAEKHLPESWAFKGDREAERPYPSMLNYVHKYLGSVKMPEPVECVTNPEFGNTPSLSRMTTAALNHLSSDNDKGFFLMIESASIDKASHRRRTCGQLGEVKQLTEALDQALAFADKNPDTLVLVTADHGQAAQLVPDTSIFSGFDLPFYTPGYLVRVKTPEGSVMAVNYATNGLFAEEHTGVNVPLFANKEGLGKVPAMITQPELFDLMTGYLNLR
ncbi:alkaline phosphatase [Endozoicomonas sp. OPT23]|uniref:alkaline phosphatase n=1 Tax=Endozoicomonas sp. OPT23 TaxID=2072845 RepID=UPI001890D75A|nr:alkaline phosphatase [Endozoicomonas sp. OPT23]